MAMAHNNTAHVSRKSETQLRLDKLLFREKLRKGLIAGGVLAATVAVLGFFAYEQTSTIDPVVGKHEVAGVVTGAKRSYARRGGFSVFVRLDKGGDITAISRLAVIPVKGEHARVMEIAHASGNKTYTVRELLP